jgi:arsenate reductase (thioredoxin)
VEIPMEKNTNKKKVIIICTGNSIRSQIAEGFFKKYKSNWEVKSAGTNPKELNLLAVYVMLEKGIDISNQKSKNIDQFINSKFDYVITVCDSAKENCPYFPGGAIYIHWSFPDPDIFIVDEEDKINEFRKVRDAIEKKILSFIQDGKE